MFERWTYFPFELFCHFLCVCLFWGCDRGPASARVGDHRRRVFQVGDAHGRRHLHPLPPHDAHPRRQGLEERHQPAAAQSTPPPPRRRRFVVLPGRAFDAHPSAVPR